MSIQIKAVAISFATLAEQAHAPGAFFLSDRAFLMTLLLVVFAILFGTCKLEATERHEGLVATIAFESLVKLVAFVGVGRSLRLGCSMGRAIFSVVPLRYLRYAKRFSSGPVAARATGSGSALFRASPCFSYPGSFR